MGYRINRRLTRRGKRVGRRPRNGQEGSRCRGWIRRGRHQNIRKGRLCGRVGATSGEHERREDDTPTNHFHGNGVMDGVIVVGTGDDVTIKVEVGVNVCVGVEKSGVFVYVNDGMAMVEVNVGVKVGTFGTQSN